MKHQPLRFPFCLIKTTEHETLESKTAYSVTNIITSTSHSDSHIPLRSTHIHTHILRRFELWTRIEKLTCSSTEIWVRGTLQKQYIIVTNKIWDANRRPLNSPLLGTSILSDTRFASSSRHPCGLCVVVTAKTGQSAIPQLHAKCCYRSLRCLFWPPMPRNVAWV